MGVKPSMNNFILKVRVNKSINNINTGQMKYTHRHRPIALLFQNIKPKTSMYGVFTYIWLIFDSKLWVNIPYNGLFGKGQIPHVGHVSAIRYSPHLLLAFSNTLAAADLFRWALLIPTGCHSGFYEDLYLRYLVPGDFDYLGTWIFRF